MHNMQRGSRKNVPLRCSIFFIWRSRLTRGAGTKNSNSTSPPPLLLCCCCCATEKHRTTSSSFPACKMSQGDAEPTCKISQGDAELKGFVKFCWCCAAPSAAPRSAILPKNMFRFGVPFPSFGVLACPGVLRLKTATSRCRSASRSSDVESRLGVSCTKSIALPHQAFQRVKYLRVTRS